MPAPCEISISLELGDEGPRVAVSPAEVLVASGGRVRVSVTGAEQFPHPDYNKKFLGVEIHMPGNHKRKVMRNMLGLGLKHVFFFDGKGGDIRIGRGLKPGEKHDTRVYAHFEGSVTTVPASSSPSMIIQ